MPLFAPVTSAILFFATVLPPLINLQPHGCNRNRSRHHLCGLRCRDLFPVSGEFKSQPGEQTKSLSPANRGQAFGELVGSLLTALRFVLVVTAQLTLQLRVLNRVLIQ